MKINPNTTGIPQLVTIEFTREEILFLASVCGKIGGCVNTPAYFLEGIYNYATGLESKTYQEIYANAFRGRLDFQTYVQK
jgi:hypothetical protein